MLLRSLLGVIVSTFAFSEPVCILCLPHAGMTPAAITRTLPTAGTKINATEANLELDVDAAAANLRDVNGRPYVELRAGGVPAAEQTWTVDIKTPGEPENTGRYSYTTSSREYGASEPYVLQAIDTIRAHTSGAGSQKPAFTATPDGRVYCVFEDQSASPGVGTIRINRWTEATELWTAPTTIWAVDPLPVIGLGGYHATPAIWHIPSDATIGYTLFVGAFWARSATEMVWKISVSNDGATTWSEYDSNLVLTYGAADVVDHAAVAYDPLARQLTMMLLHNAGGAPYDSVMYISDDYGASWRNVTAGAVTNPRAHGIVYSCGVVYYAYVNTTNQILVKKRVGTTVGWETASNALAVAADVEFLAMTANESGWLYLVTRSSTDEDEIQMQVSLDGGTSWGSPAGEYPYDDGTALIVVDDDADAGTTTLVEGLEPWAAVWSTGTLFLGGNLRSTSSTVDKSLLVMRFGTYSTLAWTTAYSGIDSPYYPSGFPAAKGPQFQAFAGGSGQSIVVGGGPILCYRVDATNSTGINEYRTVANTEVVGGIWALHYNSLGGSTATSAIAMHLQADNTAGTQRLSVTARVDATNGQIQIYDINAAANIGGVTNYDNTLVLYLLGVLDGQAQRTSWYWRQPGQRYWTAIVTNQIPAQVAAAIPAAVLWGKLTASTADVYTAWIHFMSGVTDSWIGDLASGTQTLNGIRSSSRPQRINDGIYLWWQGGLLPPAGQWTVDTISRTPLERLSPLSAAPSPTYRWIGTAGGAGATYRVLVYDLGASYRSKISTNLVHFSWWNFLNGLAQVRLLRWDGAAWQSVLTQSTYYRPFGADGAVAWTRAAATSYLFTPDGANGTPRAFDAHELIGWWCRIGDGVNLVAGTIKRVDPGQFSNATGILQMSIELDPAGLIEEAGTFAALATTTATGRIILCPPDGVAFSTQATESIRYYCAEITLPPGVTTPQGGLITVGPSYPLARAERDGSSLRFVAPSELRQIPGQGTLSGRKLARRGKRTVEFPFEQILLHAGRYLEAGGQAINTHTWVTNPHALVDNNLDVIGDLTAIAGAEYPVALVMHSQQSGAFPHVVFGESVMLGYLKREFDRVASRGILRPDVAGYQQGGALVLEELI